MSWRDFAQMTCHHVKRLESLRHKVTLEASVAA